MLRGFTLLSVAVLVPLIAAQEDVAKRIYSSAADSVVYIYIEQDGKPLGMGSGFVVNGGKVLTNAHVAQSGKPFLMAGPAKIPLAVDRIDATNDLALLTPGVELVATPLEIQAKDPVAGETVFAIGNPEGLEKTISQGIVSALRDFDGRKLIQMTSPVSHGSSGGPVLNKSGEVVGVTVGMFKEGQNLNFAVPGSVIQKFLAGATTKDDADELLSQIDIIAASRGEYSDDPESEWQKAQAKIDGLFEKAISASWNNALLLKRIVADDSAGLDLAVRAWQRIAQIEPTAANYKELANKQYWSVYFESDDSKKTKVLSAAEMNVRLSISKLRVIDSGTYLLLARVLAAKQKCQEAESVYRKALLEKEVVSEDESSTLRSLIDCAVAVKLPEQAERYFRMLVAKGYAKGWDWNSEASRLWDREAYGDAGEAYQTAAQLLGDVYGRKSWCMATQMYYFANKVDAALASGRTCIGASEGKKDTDKDLELAHETIATILNGRGVYTEALSHAKEAAAINSSNAWAYYDMAQALRGLGRSREAISAAQQAIKYSDGKYGYMHFLLGNAYFDGEDWRNAEQSFRKAAELEPKDADAAYNVALCLLKQGYYGDAASWYEEVLRRNPQYKERADILERIRVLRGR
jgi:tetratricopeptide (TPR) repeat protein